MAIERILWYQLGRFAFFLSKALHGPFTVDLRFILIEELFDLVVNLRNHLSGLGQHLFLTLGDHLLVW